MEKRLILVVLLLVSKTKLIINSLPLPHSEEEHVVTFEGTTFNDKVLANGFKPKRNRFKNKRIVALDAKFIKKHNLMNKTFKVTIEYLTKKGKFIKTDSVIVMDKINNRFNNKRIDFFDNKNNKFSDNIGTVKFHLK